MISEEENITFKTLSSDHLYRINKGKTIGEVRQSVASILGTEYWLIDIVNIENFFVYDPETTTDVLHNPFCVMVWAESRAISGCPTTTKPDIIWEYESDPRLELSCGHAITPDNLHGFVREKILQNEHILRKSFYEHFLWRKKMETLSIILLCVFIPVTVLLSICLLCIHLHWKKKWRSITKENDIEAKGDIKNWNQSKENVKHTLRVQGRLEDAQKALQTTCPEFVDKSVGVDYAVSDKCIQSDERGPSNQDSTFVADEKLGGRKKKQKKKSKATKRSIDAENQDGAKHIRVEESKLFEFDPPIGNKNLGNTCFFNSSLQALYFTKFFEDALSLLKVSAPNFKNLKLTKSVLELLEKKNVNHTQELRGVLNAVRSINNQFGRGTQEDSYELLNTLLGGILDELQNGDKTCKPIDVDSGVIGISLKNLFTGLFITIYVYDSCNDVEVDFEEFTTLSIPIADNVDQNFKKLPHRGLQTISSEDPRFDIEKGLAVLTQIEDYEESDLPCRICNIEGTGKAYRRMLVFKPPPVLVIHIDRFKMNDFNRLTKNAQRLKYPQIFNMAKFCSVANTELSTNSLNYELYAVVVHSGALGGGHYYAYVNTTRMHDVEKWQEHLKRSSLDLEKLKSNVEEFLRKRHEFQDDSGQTEVCKVKDSWFYVSDESVCSASVDEVISHKDAYILFYEVH